MATSQVDQKRALLKLKHELEPFRTAIVGVYGVLTWEKQYYAGVVVGCISFIYLMLWYMDLSFITLLSLLALMVIVGDFIFPTLSRLIFSNDKWDGEYEAKFEEVCNQMYTLKNNLCYMYEYLFKERKSTVFVFIISLSLVSLAWVGAIVNNLLLMYFTTVIIGLWPGLQEKHVFKAITEKISKLINDKFQCGKNKIQ